METALLRQACTAGTFDADDDPQAAASTDGAPGPGAALIATCHPGTMQRLRGILESGRGLGAAAILLGPWQPGVTCQVAADGMITDVAPPGAGLDGVRLFNLGANDAAAILAVLRDAHGTQPTEPDLAPPVGARPPARPAAEAVREARPAASPYLPAPVAPAPPGPAGAADAPPEPSPAASVNIVPAADMAAVADGEAAAPDTPSPVHLTMLGPLRITVGGREIGGGLRKARELLAFLAVHPEGASGEAISEALWPESDTSHATGQRNLALRKARDMLSAATGLAAPMWILHGSGRYRLDPNLISTDLWQFSEALDEARHAATDEARRLPAGKRPGSITASWPRAKAMTGLSPTPRPPAAAPWTPGPPSPTSSSPATLTRPWPPWNPRSGMTPTMSFTSGSCGCRPQSAGQKQSAAR